MLEKTRKNSLLVKESSFPSWYSASAWIGWWWSRRCLLWLYFSSCIADIVEQHGPAGSSWAESHVQDSVCKSPFSSGHPRTSTSAALTTAPTACALTHKQMVLRAWTGASVALCVCVCACACAWVWYRGQRSFRHTYSHMSTWHHMGNCLPYMGLACLAPKIGVQSL